MNAGLPANVDPNMPAHMQGDVGAGLDDLGDYIIPPRVKVVQLLTDAAVKAGIGEAPGSVGIMPQKMPICGPGEVFYFTPLFFFPEWITWRPAGHVEPIAARTFQREDPIAAKAKNATLREETIDGVLCKHTEHLNWIGVIHNNPLLGMTPLIISFARGEHRVGANFASMLKIRNAPMFGTVWEFKSAERANAAGQKWWGIDPTTPSNGMPSYIADEKVYGEFKNIHQQMAAAHAANQIVVDHSDDAPQETEF